MTDDQKAPVQPASVAGLIGCQHDLQEREKAEAAVAGMRRLFKPGEFVPVGRAKMERMARMMALAYKIADESAVSLLESSLLRHGAGWLDTATAEPADDPAILEAIDYLELRGMLERHPGDLALMRIIEQGGAHD